MTTLNTRIAALSALGTALGNISEERNEELFISARADNSWFTADNIMAAIKGVRNYLQEDKLKAWSQRYTIRDQKQKVGIVMAGNIPLVGFHDLLSVLISGNEAHVKLSSQDTALMTYVIEALKNISPEVADLIKVRDQMKAIDAVIATGSDNTSRYFEYYFAQYPHIIRKNRTACAVLTGDENQEALAQLGEDIFMYYGLGCRNVSKLFVPTDYSFNKFYEALEPFKNITHHHKYTNNYDYNKSIYLVNGEPHLDNGFLMLKEEKSFVSPISVVFYERYENEKELSTLLDQHKEKIQCIVSGAPVPGAKPFGKAQLPELWDYADGVDTMQFLTGL